jgi:hypothetical protein
MEYIHSIKNKFNILLIFLVASCGEIINLPQDLSQSIGKTLSIESDELLSNTEKNLLHTMCSYLAYKKEVLTTSSKLFHQQISGQTCSDQLINEQPVLKLNQDMSGAWRFILNAGSSSVHFFQDFLTHEHGLFKEYCQQFMQNPNPPTLLDSMMGGGSMDIAGQMDSSLPVNRFVVTSNSGQSYFRLRVYQGRECELAGQTQLACADFQFLVRANLNNTFKVIRNHRVYLKMNPNSVDRGVVARRDLAEECTNPNKIFQINSALVNLE